MPEQRTMTLEDLLSACSREQAASAAADSRPQLIPEDANPRLAIRSLAYDSARVGEGALFFCVPGHRHDGHEFAPEAVRRGAVALVVERRLDVSVPQVMVKSVRAAMGPLAAAFFGEPSSHLRVAGVTGTNGKTTTTFLLRELLEAGGTRCGLLGTIKSVIAGAERPAGRTTPEAIDLQADLREMLDGGDEACAIEVSSHALALDRTAGMHFAVAIFTNLTQDHLDFHDSMESYFQAKRALFLSEPGVSVINVGDPYGRRLAAELPNARTFAVDGEGDAADREPAADYRASDVRCDARGSRFTLLHPDGTSHVALAMPGRFNVANALAALVAARSMGVELAGILERLAQGVHVPGRFEPVAAGQEFTVLVDYAHTPDSLARVLSSARDLLVADQASGAARLICVFGAGGDRDRGKRPLMGEAAARGADVIVVTSDNPRSEEPAAIVEEIMVGVRRCLDDGDSAEHTEVHAVLDRRQAIARALALAQANDLVVIAGKGHEQGQELADGRTVPFDDVSVAREELANLVSASDGRRLRSRPGAVQEVGKQEHGHADGASVSAGSPGPDAGVALRAGGGT